jgi:hypothetical protein
VICAVLGGFAFHRQHLNSHSSPLTMGYPPVSTIESDLVTMGKMGGLVSASAHCPSTFVARKGTTFDCVVSGTNHDGVKRSLSVPVTLDARPGFAFGDYSFN